jgi:hypothetical protein
MPSGTRRTHGGSRPVASPGAGDAVEGAAREAGQPADPGLDQSGIRGRGRLRYRPRPPAHRRAPSAGTRPRIGLDQAAVDHRGPAGKPSGAVPKCGAQGTPRTRRPACGRPYSPQGGFVEIMALPAAEPSTQSPADALVSSWLRTAFSSRTSGGTGRLAAASAHAGCGRLLRLVIFRGRYCTPPLCRDCPCPVRAGSGLFSEVSCTATGRSRPVLR